MIGSQTSSWREKLEREGFAVIDGVLPGSVARELVEVLEEGKEVSGARGRNERVYALRNLLADFPRVRELAGSGVVRGLVEPVLGAGAFVVRGLLFDKNAGANWKVIWHHDITVEVEEKREVEGCGP